MDKESIDALTKKQIVQLYPDALYRVEVKDRIIYAQLSFCTINGFVAGGDDIDGSYFELELEREECRIQPILRNLFDIAHYGHKNTYYSLTKKIYTDTNRYSTVDTPASLIYAIHRNYDAFDLIESGDAIDLKDCVLSMDFLGKFY